MSSLDKEPINSKEFNDYFETNIEFEKYYIDLINETYSSVNEAHNVDKKYSIYYFDCKNVIAAKYEFGKLVSEVNKNYDKNTVKTSKSIGNTERYAIGDSETYSVVSRIGTTIIHTSTVPKKYQEEVKGYLDELGY